MITGAHLMLYSRDAEADRRFFRDVLRFPHVDAGHDWLIFSLPATEMGVHPADEDSHQCSFICEDIEAFVAEMARAGVECSEITQAGWGRLVRITLPGGGKLGVYQPRHARPNPT